MRIPVAAALMGLAAASASATASSISTATATPIATSTVERDRGLASAVRFDIGASAQATVSGQVINSSARVGAGLAPPSTNMVARRTTVSAADGSLVPALVYDFE